VHNETSPSILRVALAIGDEWLGNLMVVRAMKLSRETEADDLHL